MKAEGEGAGRPPKAYPGVERHLAALALVGADGGVREVVDAGKPEDAAVLRRGMMALAAAGACAKGALMATGLLPLDAGVWN